MSRESEIKWRSHVRSKSFSEHPMRDGWSCIHWRISKVKHHMMVVLPKTSRYSREARYKSGQRKQKLKIKKKQVTPNTLREVEGVHLKGSIWYVLRKGGRSLTTSPKLLELVSCLIDIILCINNLSSLLLLTIVKPYLSTNKQLHYITNENLKIQKRMVIMSLCHFMLIHVKMEYILFIIIK